MAKSNSKHEQYVQRTEAFLQELQKSMVFEIVDVEFVREAGMWYLRAYCDMEGGIGVEDCADISRKVSDWLDREDFISENYVLEISSPGLGRQLKKDRDLVRENGKEVEIRLFKAVDKQKEFTGVLKGFDDQNIVIENEGTEVVLERSNIAMIRLALDF